MDPISDMGIAGVLATITGMFAENLPSEAVLGDDVIGGITSLVNEEAPSTIGDAPEEVKNIYNSVVSSGEDFSKLSEEEISQHINNIAKGLKKKGLIKEIGDSGIVKKIMSKVMKHKKEILTTGTVVGGSAPIVHFAHVMKKKWDKGFSEDKKILRKAKQNSGVVQEMKRYFF